MRHRGLDLGVAFPRSPAKTQEDDDLIPPIEALFDVDREVFEQGGGLLPIPPHRLTPAIDGCVGQLARIVGLDLRMHELNCRVEVAASERLVTAASQIEVLLGHRPSIPQVSLDDARLG